MIHAANTLKDRRGLLRLVLLLLMVVSTVAAKPISPYLLGQNAWMPSWFGGSINQLWGRMQNAGFQTIRIGGNAAMTDNKDFSKVIQLIDGVRSSGAEPIVQVPHDFSAQQAIDYINYINGTMHRGIRLWCIGNEPDNNNVGDAVFVGAYLRRIGSALKSVDANAVVMGPETASYNSAYLPALVGGSADVTGIDTNGNYPIDIITWHTYNFNTSAGIEANVNDMLGRLATRNATRPANRQLSWGITEINTHWNMDLVTNSEQYTWSFHAGQLFAELYDLGMRKGGFTLCGWSMHEHGGDRSGTDLSLFDTPAEGFPGRSTYFHALMMGQNFRSNYLAHVDNRSDVKVIAMGDARGVTLMILNENTNTAFDYVVKLDTNSISPRTLQIQIDAGLNVEYRGTIPAFATHALVFSPSGSLTRRYEYTALNSAARVGPKIDAGVDDTLLLHYQMGGALPQVQDATNTVAGSALTAGAGLNVFELNAGLTYPSAPVMQVNFKLAGTNLATALTQTNLFQFQMTVGAKVGRLDLTQLSFNVARGGDTTPRGYGVYVTTPTVSNKLVQPATEVNTVRPNWSSQEIDLTGISSLQNLSAGEKITFTIPAYSPANNNSLEFDDLKVRGSVSPQIVITGAEVQSHRLTLHWTSTPNRYYAVEYSFDLKTWETLAANVIGAAAANETAAELNLDGRVDDAVLLQYQMGAAMPQVQDAQHTAAGGPLTAGAGLNQFNLSFDQYDSAPSLLMNFNSPQTNLTAALAANAWFSFTLTAGSAVGDLDLTSLSFRVARGGASMPRGYAIYVTTSTMPFTLVQPATEVAAQRPDWGSLQTVNLSAIPALQNLTAGEVVTFYVPVYAPEAVQSLEFDDLTVRGNLTPLNPPPYASSDHLFLRVKQQ